ncbi:MAG TPA: hypothetical protein VEL03_15310 [Streptosporangiaceae bacterium]|nr:hypothetical protein [Streptosporangiaceae bacterium]
MTTMQPEEAGIAEGVEAGLQRAPQFQLEPVFQPEFASELSLLVAANPQVGSESWKYFAEVATVASIGRQQQGQTPLGREDLRLAFSFWEWLFDGLVRR